MFYTSFSRASTMSGKKLPLISLPSARIGALSRARLIILGTAESARWRLMRF